MAASTTPETRGLLTAGRYRLLRELGSRVLSTFAALHEENGGNHLFVVERLARGGRVGDEEAADYIRDARRIAELEHPNIMRVREVGIRPDEVVVASDYIEGETLGALLGFAALGDAGKAPLDVLLRVLVDVLTGLGALHNLRDVKRQPLKLVHGELTPSSVVVGLDGTARLVQVCRVQALATRPGRTGSGYLAPEVLLADGSADPRSDVYSVGVLLWEALSGKRMLSEAAPHAIVANILSGRIARATVPVDLPWANDLVAVAHRALAADPNARFANSAAMAAELRRVAGSKLATTGRVASFVKQAYGAKIAARREALVTHEGSVVTTSPVAPTASPVVESDLDEATQSRMTTSPPPPVDDGFDIPIDSDSLDADQGRLTSPGPEPSPPAIAAPPPKPPVAIAAPPPKPPVAIAAPPPARPPIAPPRAWTALGAVMPPPVAPTPEPPAAHAAIAPVVMAPASFDAGTKAPPIASPIASPATLPLALPVPAPIASPVTLPLASPVPAPIAPPDVAALDAMPPLPVAPPVFDDEPAFQPPPRRKWLVIAAIAVPLVLLLSWGGCRALSPSDSKKDVAVVRPAPSASASVTATAAATATATATATTTAPPTDVAAPTPPVVEPPASAAPSATDTAPARPPAFVPGYVPPKPPARPQPTYDPQGI